MFDANGNYCGPRYSVYTSIPIASDFNAETPLRVDSWYECLNIIDAYGDYIQIYDNQNGIVWEKGEWF